MSVFAPIPHYLDDCSTGISNIPILIVLLPAHFSCCGPREADSCVCPCLSDIYVYAVLVCCVGILSILLFMLVIVWQSVFNKRKSRGKKTDKVMSGMGAHPDHRWAEDARQSTTLVEKCIVSQGLFICDCGQSEQAVFPLDSAKIHCGHH